MPDLVLAGAFGLALALSALLTPPLRKLSFRFGFLAVPNGPKHEHKRPTGRLGGVAVFVAFVVALLVTAPFVPRQPEEVVRLFGLMLGATLVFVVGLLDDKYDLPPGAQFGAQFVAAVIAVLFNVTVRNISNPWGAAFTPSSLWDLPLWFAAAFTVFWFMGMVNTINWSDGLDGLAGGIVVIAVATLALHSLRLPQQQFSIAVTAVILVGAVLGFMPYNFHPASIFLGSCGVFFMGYMLAGLAILGGAKLATALMVLAVPILDVAWVILRRLLAHRAPWRGGDREHLHNRLVDLGWSQRRIVLLFYALCIVLGGLALVLPSPLVKLYVILAAFAVLLAGLAWVARIAQHTGGRATPRD